MHVRVGVWNVESDPMNIRKVKEWERCANVLVREIERQCVRQKCVQNDTKKVKECTRMTPPYIPEG